MYLALRTWRKVRGQRELRRHLHSRYKNLCRAKKKAYTVKQLEGLMHMMRRDPRNFWKHYKPAKEPLPRYLQQTQKWDGYMQELAERAPPVCPQPSHTAYPQMPTEPAAPLNSRIQLTEVQAALKAVQRGKAPGPSGLTAEFLACAPEAHAPGEARVFTLGADLTTVLNAAFKTGKVPQSIKACLLTPVLKKGDPLDTANYRPIAVMESLLRIYAQILNTRLFNFA